MKALTFNSIYNYAATATTTTTEEMDKVYGRMGGVTRYLYENMPSYESAGFVVFILVFILCAIVYKLGFEREGLALWKRIIIYIFLFLGCIILTFLALFLPMIEGLIIATIILIIYKFRLKLEKKEQKAENK